MSLSTLKENSSLLPPDLPLLKDSHQPGLVIPSPSLQITYSTLCVVGELTHRDYTYTALVWAYKAEG